MVMNVLARFLLPAVFAGNVFAQGAPTAAGILRSALKASEKIETIEYEVRRETKGADGKAHRGRTVIRAGRSPLGIQARFEEEDSGTRDMAVLEGNVTRYSSEGVSGEVPRTFVASGQVIPNRSATDAAMTWRLFLDREFLSTAIESGNIVYAGKDDIEGDLCSTVMYVRVGQDSGSTIEWYWISDKTGLPRAAQRINLRRGATRLTDRAVISVVRINPHIPAGTFTYSPAPADSTPAASPAAARTPRSLRGTRLPDLEVRDTSYAALKLSELAGKPLLITFWAPWCFYCIEEMQALVKLRPSYQGKLKVVAIATQDSRLNVVSWVKEHPQFDFQFLTDPELPDQSSRLSTYFEAKGIPVSVLVAADGTVVENWFGFESEQDLAKKLGELLERRPGQ
jgi:thiol-disulfide isomerase/thioredoxin/outer membrane lipoprotein-sorting protein